MSEAEQSGAMQNLVKILVGLAILGIVIAFVVYFGVGLPSRAWSMHR